MPYTLKGNCVYKKDTGEKVGCSDDRATAVKHLHALYAAASGEKMGKKELYKSLDTLENVAYQIMESGPDELQDLAEQILINIDTDDRDDSKTLLRELADTFTANIKGLINPPVSAKPTITFKDEGGRTRVMMRVSNNFKDRHGEIITEEAHKAYVDYVTKSGDYPEFWVWHIPGSRWGKADVVDYSDGFLTASGLVDVGMEQVAKSVARDDWGVSHGFRGVSLTGKGFIDAYKSFEFSPLPREAAANIVTGVMLVNKEAGMDPTKRQKLLEVGVSEEFLDKWGSGDKSAQEVLKALGIEYKETESTPDPEPEPEPVPDEPKLSDVLAAIGKISERLEGVEKSYKDLEKKSEDYVASVLEPAIRPGGSVGFVASKSNGPPSDQITKSNEEWEHELAEFLTGKAVS